MKTNSRSYSLRLPLLAAAVASLLPSMSGCNDTPTTAVVDNGFPTTPGKITVYKVWWVTTLFPRPVAPGTSSESERTIPGTDFAYALLAPGWSPEDGAKPPRLVAAKSAAKLSVSIHDLLHISVSDDTFIGNCAAGKALPAGEAQIVVERIFPGDFAGATYDPTTCVTTVVDLDAGTTDGSQDDLSPSDTSADRGSNDTRGDARTDAVESDGAADGG